MTISITNTGYLAQSVKNRPIIGWHSVVGPSGFSAAGSGVDNLWSPDTYTFWSSAAFASLEDPTITFANNESQEVTYAAVAGHNAGDSFAEIVLERSINGVDWIEIDRISDPGNDPAIFYIIESFYDFYRIRFDVDFNSVDDADFIKVAHARFGVALVLERPTFVGNSPFNRSVEKLTNQSDSGKYLGSTLVSEVRQYDIQQQHNSDTFIREYIEPFLEHCQLIGGGGEGPKGSFFYAWRPEEFPGDVYYCHDPQSVTWPSYSRPNKAIGFDWSISGMAEK